MAVLGGRPREEGYLVLADVTGYTSFLTRTELEHADGIVAELTTLVIAQLARAAPLHRAGGRRRLRLRAGAASPMPSGLIDMMEGLLRRIRLRLEEMRLATTCTCTACAPTGSI